MRYPNTYLKAIWWEDEIDRKGGKRKIAGETFPCQVGLLSGDDNLLQGMTQTPFCVHSVNWVWWGFSSWLFIIGLPPERLVHVDGRNRINLNPEADHCIEGYKPMGKCFTWTHCGGLMKRWVHNQIPASIHYTSNHSKINTIFIVQKHIRVQNGLSLSLILPTSLSQTSTQV